MTTIRQDIYTALTSGSPANRVYPSRLPKNVVLPAVVYQFITDLDDEDLAGEDQELTNVLLQVDVYSQFEAEADEVGKELRFLLLASPTLQVSTTGGFDEFEDDTRLYRVMKEYSVWRNTNV